MAMERMEEWRNGSKEEKEEIKEDLRKIKGG